ncbi:hypothetical protein NQD34_013536 [Periophthalmus magnuspinnatus]|nr:hypothetical protein NQD34_013536 [Periophthalmus magnuspinnatus]
MGCQCCRMIKSYIYDPSVGVDGRKSDPAVSSLYQSHHHSGAPPAVETLAADMASTNRESTTPASAKVHRQASAPPAQGDLYIIQPDAPGPRWIMQEQPSQVPVYPEIQSYGNQIDYNDREVRTGWSTRECRTESVSADEIDEGVGGTPEYPCDTGDEGSVLSVDIHTSTTSLSSADTKDDHKAPKTPELSTVESGILVSKSEDEEEEGEEPKNEAEEVESVTDSMVAEALAALEAATAGEEFE